MTICHRRQHRQQAAAAGATSRSPVFSSVRRRPMHVTHCQTVHIIKEMRPNRLSVAAREKKRYHVHHDEDPIFDFLGRSTHLHPLNRRNASLCESDPARPKKKKPNHRPRTREMRSPMMPEPSTNAVRWLMGEHASMGFEHVLIDTMCGNTMGCCQVSSRYYF